MNGINKIFKNFLIRQLRAIDNLITAIQKIRPKSHIKYLRIIKEKIGEINPGDNVCIFIVYENKIIPKLTLETLIDIKSMGIKLFIVVNSKLNSEN